MDRKGKVETSTVILVLVLIAGFYVIVTHLPSNIYVPQQTGGGGQNQTSYYYYGNGTQYPYPTAAPDYRAPTSLMVQVNPNPVALHSNVFGTVTSNGYNYPIAIYAKVRGPDQTVSFGALIPSDGVYYHHQPMEIAGYWEFWATTDSVTSNVYRLTVEGVQVTASDDFYSKTLSLPLTFKVFSNYHGTATLTASLGGSGAPVTLATFTVNSLGYGETTITLGLATLGNYEIDVSVGGHKASAYSATCWVQVGR